MQQQSAKDALQHICSHLTPGLEQFQDHRLSHLHHVSFELFHVGFELKKLEPKIQQRLGNVIPPALTRILVEV